jgi:hypothetical protein
MNPQLVKILVGGAIFLHGVAHAVALVALMDQAASGPAEKRITVHSWLDLQPKTSALVAVLFWLVSTACFLAAALSIWGILLEPTTWGQLALIGAVVSLLGTVLFQGTWPGAASRERNLLNTGIAVAFNLIVLAALLVFEWPSET